MSFIFLIFATAFLMEAIGTFISIVGLGALFAGDPIILTMAVILDVAKIVSVSFIYQYWYKVKAVMKYYLLAAVLILMTITSAGAFGYLSGAFQKAIQPGLEVSLKVDSFKHESAQLLTERDELTKQRQELDKQVAQLPPDFVKGRRQLINSFKPEQDRIRDRINVISKRVDELSGQILRVESENIEKEVHVGPIMYVAKAFNISVEQASKWIILTIIFIFDPLAIILIITGNFLVKLRDETPKIATETLKDSSKTLDDNKVLYPPVGFDRVVVTGIADITPTIPLEMVPVEFPKSDSTWWHEDNESIPKPDSTWQHEDEFETKLDAIPFAYDPLKSLVYDPIDSEVPLTDEELLFLSAVYDDVDTGEKPEYEQCDDVFDTTGVLAELIQDYVPSNPLQIEINGDISFSGSPQTDLIEEPMRSSLESLKINLPEALLRNGVTTTSSKKSLYE